MTEPMQCRYPDCRRQALPDMSRCEAHRMRWLPREPVEQPAKPEWLRRLVAKDLTGWTA